MMAGRTSDVKDWCYHNRTDSTDCIIQLDAKQVWGKPFYGVSVLKNMVSHCTLDLVSWKFLPKTSCPKCLIRYDTIRWWTEFSDSRQICPYLNTDPVVKQLTRYIGLYDLNRKRSRLFANWPNVQYIHDISHLLWIFDKNAKYDNNLELAWPPIDLA